MEARRRIVNVDRSRIDLEPRAAILLCGEAVGTGSRSTESPLERSCGAPHLAMQDCDEKWGVNRPGDFAISRDHPIPKWLRSQTPHLSLAGNDNKSSSERTKKLGLALFVGRRRRPEYRRAAGRRNAATRTHHTNIRQAQTGVRQDQEDGIRLEVVRVVYVPAVSPF